MEVLVDVLCCSYTVMSQHGCRYVAVYFSILYLRFRAGIVTKEMVAVPKSRFMAIGLLEALGVASGMSAGGNLWGIYLKYFVNI